MEAPVATAFDRHRLARLADGAAAAVAASLPWSTSATGILVVVWFVALLSTLDLGLLRREIMTPAGGAPLILVALAGLGMAWADVGLGQRLQGFEGYLKLLCIPFLLVQFRGSPRGWWVIYGFFAATAALLALSFALAWIPGLPWRGKMLGVPVKDYITQSGIFALCAFALLGCAMEAWRERRRQLAWALVLIAAGFIADIAFVSTGRTTLITLAVLVPILGFRAWGWKGAAAAGLVGGALAGALWASSPYLRQRVTHAADEVEVYRTEHTVSSAGLRLDFWKSSIEAIEKAPIVGNGTGSIPEQLRSAIAPETGIASFATVNPHNEVLVVTIQLGLIGTAALLSMWTAHLLLFRGGGAVSWIGLVAVVQNMVGSLFNSHLSDFTQGWIYVFAVGALGGTALRQAALRPPKGSSGGGPRFAPDRSDSLPVRGTTADGSGPVRGSPRMRLRLPRPLATASRANWWIRPARPGIGVGKINHIHEPVTPLGFVVQMQQVRLGEATLLRDQSGLCRVGGGFPIGGVTLGSRSPGVVNGRPRLG